MRTRRDILALAPAPDGVFLEVVAATSFGGKTSRGENIRVFTLSLSLLPSFIPSRFSPRDRYGDACAPSLQCRDCGPNRRGREHGVRMVAAGFSIRDPGLVYTNVLEKLRLHDPGIRIIHRLFYGWKSDVRRGQVIDILSMANGGEFGS